MNVAVTGADGFVGQRLVARLLDQGHAVTVGIRPPGAWTPPPAVRVLPLEVTDDASIAAFAGVPADAVVHLAAVASGAEARSDPGHAWTVNAAGTARLAEHLARRPGGETDRPLLLLVSTAEVYGPATTPRVESDPVVPVSPYAASKLAAEIAALEVHRRTGLRVVIARSFPHSGPGQDDRFVLPAFTRRLVLAKRMGAPAVKVGNLDVVREFLHVADVVDAYMLLLERGANGAVYNVARGEGVALRDVFGQLADLVGHRAVPETDPALVRRADIGYLVGDHSRLTNAVGWQPRIPLNQLLQELVDAETH